MKRHRSSAFSTGILAMAVAVAGLVSTTPAQAQTYKYGPSGINPQQNVWIQITGTQAEFRGSFNGAYVGTMNASVPSGPGVQNAVNFTVRNAADNDSQPVVGWVSSTQFYINHANGTWNLNLESGPPANYPPTVSITAPAGGATYTAPATVNITASASDTDGTIAKVEFYQGATKLGEDTDSSGGWTYSWTGVAAGAYSLTAKAFDNGGASTISAAVGITVNQPAAPPEFDAASCSPAGDNISVGFNAEDATTYTIQYRNSLTAGDWQKLEDVPSGSARPVVVTDDTAGIPQRCYRIVSPATP